MSPLPFVHAGVLTVSLCYFGSKRFELFVNMNKVSQEGWAMAGYWMHLHRKLGSDLSNLQDRENKPFRELLWRLAYEMRWLMAEGGDVCRRSLSWTSDTESFSFLGKRKGPSCRLNHNLAFGSSWLSCHVRQKSWPSPSVEGWITRRTMAAMTFGQKYWPHKSEQTVCGEWNRTVCLAESRKPFKLNDFFLMMK